MPNKTAASDTDTVFQSGRRYANGRNKGMLRITLYGILFFLVILYGLSFVPRSSRERAMRSAFVNEKHTAALDEIEIENAGEKTSLYKKNGTWYGSSGGVVFPAENAKVSELIQYLTKIRKLYTILDSNNTISDKNRPFVSILLKNNLNMSTKVNFYGQNFDQTRRFIRIGESDGPYAAETDCDAFLRADAGFWLDPYIVPQNTEERRIRAADIQSLRIAAKGVLKTLKAGEHGFSEKASKLIALRHGGLAADTEGFYDTGAFSLTVETGRGFRFTATAENGKAGAAALRFDSFQNTVTGTYYEYRYRVSVSAWTLEKIVELFIE